LPVDRRAACCRTLPGTPRALNASCRYLRHRPPTRCDGRPRRRRQPAARNICRANAPRMRRPQPRAVTIRSRVLIAAIHAIGGRASTAQGSGTVAAATVLRRMTHLGTYRPRLEALLTELAGAHRVPGASCGVLAGGASTVVAHGVANVATQVEVT